MFKYFVTGIGIMAAIFAFLMFSCKLPIGCTKANNTFVGTLNMWGTLPTDEVQDVVSQMGIDAKTYSITYTEIPEADFESKLVDSLANGEGPDLILADYKTLIAQKSRILPFPYTSFPATDYKNSFIDGASIFLSSDGIVAFPVTVEPLMMFVNRDIISQNGIATAGVYWDDIVASMSSLSKRDKTGKLIQYGAGLGATDNVTNMKEIIMSLITVLGGEPVSIMQGGDVRFTGNQTLSDTSQVRPLREALKLYSQFSDPNKDSYSWDNYTGTFDKDAFIQGKLAYYFGFSGEGKEIAEKNERLNFYMTNFPRARGYDTKATTMRMYGVAVMKRTPQNLVMTAYNAQSTLANSNYGTRIVRGSNKQSPIRSVISGDTTLDAGIKSSILVARGWYDFKHEQSTALLSKSITDLVSGQKTVTQSADSFVDSFNSLYGAR